MAEKTLLHVCESVWLRGHPSTASEGAVPSAANRLLGRASGAASGGLLGVFGVCRKYFWVTHTLSFRWHTHSSVYSDLR